MGPLHQAVRRATQPAYETNRRAMLVLLVFLLLVAGYLVASHTILAAHPHPLPPATGGNPLLGPSPNPGRNPFQAP